MVRHRQHLSDMVRNGQQLSEIAGDDPLAQRIYQSYLEFKENVVSYHEITERAYINARAATANSSRK